MGRNTVELNQEKRQLLFKGHVYRYSRRRAFSFTSLTNWQAPFRYEWEIVKADGSKSVMDPTLIADLDLPLQNAKGQ
jgi:hypothetical protein